MMRSIGGGDGDDRASCGRDGTRQARPSEPALVSASAPGAFVQARTQVAPGNQMIRRREGAHVGADFSDRHCRLAGYLLRSLGGVCKAASASSGRASNSLAEDPHYRRQAIGERKAVKRGMAVLKV
jgi:hypothetical protein